jgi:hypothetical protein
LQGCNLLLRDSNSLLQGILDLIKDKKELPPDGESFFIVILLIFINEKLY